MRPQTTVGLILAALLFAIVTAAPLFATGSTEEADFEQVEGTGNWEYTIDVSDREPGLYNILVRARDEAGNVSLGGPYNVFVDPASDLPLVSISYPVAGQAVGERLFVVGTARDDDAVDYVQVQVNDAGFQRAEGSDYWSALLPMTNLSDGPHVVRARAVDVNGVEGEPVEVAFRLDTTSPDTTPTSHESGVLISRRTTIQGTVEDANGIRSLTLVAGDERQELRLQGGANETRRFSFEIDPAEMDEGATVWWLESTDRTGLEGVTPFLFFVDTSPPELEILHPTEDDRVDAQLRFAGRVSDQVGLDSLTYRLSSGEEGEIELTPGDPFWALEATLEPGSRGAAEAVFTVTDVAGNETTTRVRRELDWEGDRPVVAVAMPSEGDVLDTAILSGHVSDDDGVDRLIYSLDDGEAVELTLPPEASDGFTVPLPGLSPGTHTLRVHAVDRHGVSGPEQRISFTRARPAAALAVSEVVRGETTEAYEPGFALTANERASLVVRVSAPAQAPLPSRINYRIGPSSGTASVDENSLATIPLPRSSEGAAVPVELYDRTETGHLSRMTGFYVQLPEQEEEAPEPTREDVLSRGLYLTSGELETPDENGAPSLRDEPVTLTRGQTVRLLAVGGRPQNPELSGTHEFLSVTTSGSHVVVRADANGTARDVTVTATVGGRTVRSDRFSIVTEHEPPQIELPTQIVGRRVRELGELAVAVRDASGVAAVRYLTQPVSAPAGEGSTGQQADSGSEAAGAAGTPGSVATVTARPQRDEAASAEAGTPATEASYLATPETPAGEGPALVRVVAEDTGGRETSLLIPVVIDRTAPQLRFLTPPPGRTVNGTITVIGLLSEPASTTRVTALEDEPVTIPVDRLVMHEVVTGGERDSMVFELADTAGNEGESSVGLTTDESADLPELQVQVPVEGGLVTDEFRLSGVLLDDDQAASVTYRVNDGEPVTVQTDGTFDVNVSMDDLVDGEHTVTVYGTDIGGAQSDPVTRGFSISRSQPVSAMSEPGIESYQRAGVTLSGTAEDPNGITLVEVSTDNGASYQQAEGTETWTHRLDTTLLDDGTHSILVRATDGAGQRSLLSTTINVDNTAPVLELVEPQDGETVSGRFLIDGRGEDPALEIVRIVAQPLDDTGEPIELVTFDRPGPFAYVVNAATLPTGWYNLRIEAEDRAGNSRRVSRNLLVQPAEVSDTPQILIPADGARLAHQFHVTVRSPQQAGPVTLFANGAPIGVIQIDESNSGSFRVEPGTIEAGPVELSLRTEPGEDGQPLESPVHTVELAAEGPWIAVDDPTFLSYVRDRPFITGRAGYAQQLPEGDDGETQREREELIRSHRVTRVEVSLDNGRSYEEARGTDEWRYRLETTELTDGRHNLLVRAQFADGSAAVTRHAVIVDEQPPEVRLLEPQERDTFDDQVRIVGVTTDENALSDVSVVLREGDKANYELPSFIQGLYLDVHGLGATYFDVGAGLTFFDNNVRLQGQIGVSPPGRFSGLVIGTKLLANVAALPASFFLGPDFEWLSGALAVGANFSYFTMSEDTIAFTSEGLVLAGMVAQLELPIIEVPDLAFFNTYAFYTEAQLWFISSDVNAGTAFRLAFGLRADVF